MTNCVVHTGDINGDGYADVMVSNTWAYPPPTPTYLPPFTLLDPGYYEYGYVTEQTEIVTVCATYNQSAFRITISRCNVACFGSQYLSVYDGMCVFVVA